MRLARGGTDPGTEALTRLPRLLALAVGAALVPHMLAAAWRGAPEGGGGHEMHEMHGGGGGGGGHGMAMTFHLSRSDPLFVDALAPWDLLSYTAVLAVLAALGAAKEWLFARRLGVPGGGGTAAYGAHLAAANLVMLAVMSYEVGYTVAAIGGSMAGHAVFVVPLAEAHAALPGSPSSSRPPVQADCCDA